MVYLHQALRTPLGKAGGIYRDTLPEVLMAHLMKEIHRRSGYYAEEVLLGNAFGTGGNMARYATLLAGYPQEIPATTVDSQCSSGMKSIELGYALLLAGQRRTVLCGGLESSSLAPEKRYAARDPRGPGEVYKIATFSPDQDGSLADAAERCAGGLPKSALWDWAKKSQQQAHAAGPLLEDYLHPLEAGQADPEFRPDFSPERYSSARYIDRTVSAHFRDGAAGVLLSTEREGALSRILACTSAGNDPNRAPEGVVAAMEGVLRMAGLGIEDIDLFEISESYAPIPFIAQAHFGINTAQINVFGGTLAYGHPYGASGTVQVIHLCAALKHFRARYGLSVIPGAGGVASAILLEHVI